MSEQPQGSWPFRAIDSLPAIPDDLDVVLVSHTHWDREWYASAEWFRGRLVGVVDQVLDQLVSDPEWAFVLDGQTIIVDDYLDARPQRRAELEAFVREGRLAIGPWYVQPDSLLPGAESHIRNLLEGTRSARSYGGTSTVAYTPDSFGHPASFPMIFSGFGLGSFVYWRGHGDEIDDLPARWRWGSNDGSEVLAFHLHGSYLAAATLEPDTGTAARRLRDLAGSLSERSPRSVVLMNGIDHAGPDSNTKAVADELRELTGWSVRRGTLDDAIESSRTAAALEGPLWSGALIGGRSANLLPGVWSARVPVKIAARRTESLLLRAERIASIATLVADADERPTLQRLRRLMLQNQAHDSIGGCSIDAVHRETATRAEVAAGGCVALTQRVAERLVGLGPTHRAPFSDEWDVAVWNPSGRERSARIRIPIEGFPAFRIRQSGIERHPAHVLLPEEMGFEVNGRPARVVSAADFSRDQFSPEHHTMDLEVEVEQIPAGGWRRLAVRRAPNIAADVDDERWLERGLTRVVVDEAGCLEVTMADRSWTGLLGVVDRGDRGDTYDADVLDDVERCAVVNVTVQRQRHVSGCDDLVVRRELMVPAGLAASRLARSDRMVPVVVETTVRIDLDGSLDIELRIDGEAEDHRLQLQIGSGLHVIEHATTLGEVRVERPDAASTRTTPPGWEHPRATTACHQGWVAADGLLVSTPGLHEVELTSNGDLFVTALRSVGWLSRPDLRTRPGRAGPSIPTPGAQCSEGIRTRLRIAADPVDVIERWAMLESSELEPLVVPAGADPIACSGTSLLAVAGAVLTAVKPAEDGDGVIVRVWNPTEHAKTALLSVGVDLVSTEFVRLDETQLSGTTQIVADGDQMEVEMPAWALRSIRLVPRRNPDWTHDDHD